MDAILGSLDKIIVEIGKAVPQIIAGIVKAFGSLMGKIVEIGGNIVKGLWDGICDFFSIHSPSREMAWVGEMLVKGLSGFIEDNEDEAVKAAEGMTADIDGVMNDLAHDMQTALPNDFAM